MSGHIIPVWKNKVAPCGGERGCPAFTDIAASLHALSRGDANHAWRIMMRTHPLRATLGRVCYAFCENPCNRGYFDTPISIQMLEAVIGDNGFDPDWRPEMAPRNGKKVMIIGAGPAGLAAGWFLNIHGFSVIIHEADEKPGGVLRYGIPSYRLPKDVLDREITLITDMGVEIKHGSKVIEGDLVKALDSGDCDAVIIATGAGKSKSADFPGEDMALNGLDFLRQVNTTPHDPKRFEGDKVVVIGGGNVAMDACRCAIRLGAKSVTVVYRRTEGMMPAHEHEVSQAREESVAFAFLLSPEEYDGKVLKARKMALGPEDESGRRKPFPLEETADIPADVVITAIGQTPEVFKVSGHDNVFLAGDAEPDSEGTVIHAIASGKRAADDVSRLLTGKAICEPLGEEVTYEKMNVGRYFEPQMRLRHPAVKASQRAKNFEPVDRIISPDEGMVEANRCFRCGMCIGGLNSDCDWCFRACDGKKSVEKLMIEWNPEGPLFKVGDDCDACGRCWEDCPRYVVRPMEADEGE